MTTIKSLNEQLIYRQDDLIQQLETVYMNFIKKLLQQKKQIIQKMQQLFREHIQKLHTLQSHTIPKKTSTLDESFVCKLLTSLLQTHLNNQSITKVDVSNINSNDKKSQCANINNKPALDSKTIQMNQKNVRNFKKTMTNQSTNVNHRYQNHFYNYINHNNVSTLNSNGYINRSVNNIQSIPHTISRQTQTNPIDDNIINGSSNYATLAGSKLTGNYKCNKCGKDYKHLCNLKIHQKIHTNSCFVCAFCGKRFGRKFNYTEHLRTHTGEAPFECPVCRKRFKQKHGMKNHMKRVHN